jgi:hypothetical protein
MKRLILCFAVCVGILTAAASTSAVTVVLKQGVDGYAGCSDTYIYYYNATSNFGSDTQMRLRANSGVEVCSDLIRFDLDGAIPPGSAIQSATLSVCLYEGLNNTYYDCITVAAQRLRSSRDWMEMEATWLLYRGGGRWYEDGCQSIEFDRFQEWESDVTVYSYSPVNTYYHWDVTDGVRAWAEGAENNGWLLRSGYQCNTGLNGMRFYTKEADIAYRPYLTIVYEPPSGVEQSTWGGIKVLYR